MWGHWLTLLRMITTMICDNSLAKEMQVLILSKIVSIRSEPTMIVFLDKVLQFQIKENGILTQRIEGLAGGVFTPEAPDI